MNVGESFRIAVRAVLANKVRSALTMLGVIIGVAAVILLVAIGTGVQGEITGTIKGLGSNLLFVFPGQINTGGGGFGGPPVAGKPFKMSDVQLLQSRLNGVDAIVPMATTSATVRVGNRNGRTSLMGANEQSNMAITATLGGGREFNRSEVDAAARVIVIGYTVKTNLFPSSDPVGQFMTVNGQRFRIIGWYEKQGGSLSGDSDNQALVPISALQALTGTSDIRIILIRVSDAANIDLIRAQARRVLEPRYGDNVTVMSQDQTLGILSTVLNTLTYMLAGIAGISLLVGGIGIMNIMLVSVSERTREIGIRKAVGARTYDILSQFVIEAMMLSITGGVVGIMLGAGGAWALTAVVPTSVTPWAVALAFFFSAGVGVFFGVYPAWKASQLDPIEALRYE